MRICTALVLSVLAGHAAGQGTDVVAVETAISFIEQPRLVLKGAWQLSAPGQENKVAELSGLDIQGDTVLAVTNHGYLLEAKLQRNGEDVAPTEITIRFLRNEYGELPDRIKDWKDAESIARLGDRLFVAFERKHRIFELGPDAWLDNEIKLNTGFEVLNEEEEEEGNKGIEAIAGLPDGSGLIAFAEQIHDGEAPWWIIDPNQSEDEAVVLGSGTLRLVGPEVITGADIGPDGKLYLVRRNYENVGTSHRTRIVVERYRLDGNEPDASSREDLAFFQEVREAQDNETSVGNVEGIAVVGSSSESLTLWLLSDKNSRNEQQRSLLMRFEIVE